MNYIGYIEVVGINPFCTQTLGVDIRTNIQDKIAQRQNCEMEKRELERQRKAMEIQETQRKWAEAMAQPVEKAQRQVPVDPVAALRLTENERADLRAKALQLSCSLYNTPYYNQSQRDIVGVAQLFYTYITKGE